MRPNVTSVMAHSLDERTPTCCVVEHSETVENYLKTYAMASQGEPLTTSRVAVRLGVSAPSVSVMVGRLTSAGLTARRAAGRIELTEHGARHAQGVLRRHRLLETLLAQTLGVPWDEIHAEAELLEHALSDRLADRIAAALGDPRHDPHGDPIPPKNGSYREDWPDPLSAAPVGSTSGSSGSPTGTASTSGTSVTSAFAPARYSS